MAQVLCFCVEWQHHVVQSQWLNLSHSLQEYHALSFALNRINVGTECEIALIDIFFTGFNHALKSSSGGG